MSLRFPTPPPRGVEILRQGLESLLSTPTAELQARRPASSDESGPGLETISPHVVYFVGLNDLAEGRMLAAARPTSWRYMLLDGDNVHSAAELAIDAGEVGWFSHVDGGPFVASTVRGVAFAERLEVQEKADYELRLLSIPSVYLVALWLHGTDDYLIPLDPAPGGLQPERAYTEPQIISLLSELALRRAGSVDPMP